MIGLALGLLGRVPFWVWPVVGLVAWGGYGNIEAKHLKKTLAAERADWKAKESAAAAQSVIDAQAAAIFKRTRDAEVKRINSRLTDAQRLLNSRPDRLPSAAAPACDGGSGAGLSRPDAGFLEGEAARANTLRAALDECQKWIQQRFLSQIQR